MSVCVDPTFQAEGPCGFRYWCHMSTDDLTEAGLVELHAMAALIGMKREWFQDKPGHPHYDLVPSRRAKAVRCGAEPLSQQDYAIRCSFPHRLRMFQNALGAASEAFQSATIRYQDRVSDPDTYSASEVLEARDDAVLAESALAVRLRAVERLTALIADERAEAEAG